MKGLAGLVITLHLVACGGAMAHDETHKHHGAKPGAAAKVKETPFGKAADPRKATRTIAVDMSDTFRFTPSEIVVKRGESVRFVATNNGKLLHEMVLGTRKDLEEHAEMMRKHPNMEHDEPHMLHVAAGKTGEMGWQFTRAGEFYFGCLVAGHFEAGMIGKIVVQ